LADFHCRLMSSAFAVYLSGVLMNQRAVIDLGELLENLADAVAQRIAQSMPAPEQQRWMNVTTAAQYLDMSEHALRALVKRQLVPRGHRGARLIFDRRDLDRWLESAA
jgi:hypothetical protein